MVNCKYGKKKKKLFLSMVSREKGGGTVCGFCIYIYIYIFEKLWAFSLMGVFMWYVGSVEERWRERGGLYSTSSKTRPTARSVGF